MKRKILASAAILAAAAMALSGCSGGGGGGSSSGTSVSASSCSTKILHKNATIVTVWAWYPNMKLVVNNFNKLHSNIQVCWNNVGQGVDEYNKVQTAISAGKGLPDVVMLEADHLPTYEIQGALVDISKYGANAVKGNFSAGAWKDVSQGSGVYAIPVDGGPMGLVYRPDILSKYGITTPPATWADFQTDAEKIKAAGGPMMADLAPNQAATLTAYMIQKGANPFTYNLADKKKIGIKVNDQNSIDVLNYWANLVKEGLVGTEDQFTTSFISAMVAGKYATYPSAAWTPGYLQGQGVGKANDGTWAAAPLPQWDTSNPVSVNWGGSTFAVTNEASDKKAATQVAMEIYEDSASITNGWENSVIFPLNKKVLNSDTFINNKMTFFDGQQANKEVYVPAENAYTGMTYSPFEVYYYSQFGQIITKMNQGSLTGTQAANELQANLVKYAQGQGFTVTQ